jgi:hypothetical protein
MSIRNRIVAESMVGWGEVVEMLLLSFCIPAYERTSLSRVSVPPTTRMELVGNIIKPKSKFVSVIIHQIDLLCWHVVHTHCISNPPPFDGSSFISSFIHSFIYECFRPLLFLVKPIVRFTSFGISYTPFFQYIICEITLVVMAVRDHTANG